MLEHIETETNFYTSNDNNNKTGNTDMIKAYIEALNKAIESNKLNDKQKSDAECWLGSLNYTKAGTKRKVIQGWQKQAMNKIINSAK